MSTLQRWNPARDFARLQDEVNRRVAIDIDPYSFL